MVSPISKDPRKRARQLSNLRQGGTVAPSGNRRAETHGGFASIAADRLQEQEHRIYVALNADLPLRDADGRPPAADQLAVSLLAECMCRIESVRSYLSRRGIEDRKGRLRPAVEVEAKLRREALDFAEALGLTPRSRSRLGLDLARTADLAAQWAAEDDEPRDQDDAIDAEATDA